MPPALQVVYKTIRELTPALRNARTHSDGQVAQLVASMKTFGWTNPILIDEANGIIAGHGRLRAAQKLKLKREELLFRLEQLRRMIPATILRHDRPPKSDVHPTMKPVSLVEQCLRASALEGQTVLDPFGGSGTTLIAAEKIGLAARLMELDPRFVDVIIRRWEAFTGKRAEHLESKQGFASVTRARTPLSKRTAAEGATA